MLISMTGKRMYSAGVRVLSICTCLKSVENMAREPLCKHLEDGIFEVRSKVGSEIDLADFVFCCQEGGSENGSQNRCWR